jgi:hypothetical protein
VRLGRYAHDEVWKVRPSKTAKFQVNLPVDQKPKATLTLPSRLIFLSLNSLGNAPLGFFPLPLPSPALILATVANAALVRSFPPLPPSYPSKLTLTLLGDLTPGESRPLVTRDNAGDARPFDGPDVRERAFPGELGADIRLCLGLDESDIRLGLTKLESGPRVDPVEAVWAMEEGGVTERSSEEYEFSSPGCSRSVSDPDCVVDKRRAGIRALEDRRDEDAVDKVDVEADGACGGGCGDIGERDERVLWEAGRDGTGELILVSLSIA